MVEYREYLKLTTEFNKFVYKRGIELIRAKGNPSTLNRHSVNHTHDGITVDFSPVAYESRYDHLTSVDLSIKHLDMTNEQWTEFIDLTTRVRKENHQKKLDLALKIERDRNEQEYNRLKKVLNK